MPGIVGIIVVGEVVEVVVGVRLCDETICLPFLIFFVAFVLFINLCFDIEKLIPGVSSSSFSWSSL